MMTEQRYWTVLYTRPFWEKKVQATIHKYFGIEAWCPLRKIQRRWSDRIKTTEEPYFRNYVFLYATEKERIAALATDGVIQSICFHGRPAQISEQEINNIKDFIEQHNDIEVQRLVPGDRVVFHSGAFVNKEGVVKQIEGNRAILRLSRLNCIMIATLADIKKVV